MRTLAIVALATGCVTEQVGVTPRELLHHVPELRATGHARVDTGGHGDYELAADQSFSVTIAGKPRRLSVRELIANCPDIPPFAGDSFRPDPPCLLLGSTIDTFPLERRRHVDREMIYMFLGAFVVVAILGTIAGAVCHESASGC